MFGRHAGNSFSDCQVLSSEKIWWGQLIRDGSISQLTVHLISSSLVLLRAPPRIGREPGATRAMQGHARVFDPYEAVQSLQAPFVAALPSLLKKMDGRNY